MQINPILMALTFRLGFLLLLTILPAVIFAQLNPVIYKGEDELKINNSYISYQGAGDSIPDALTALSYYKQSLFTINQNGFLNLGIAKDNYWIAVKIHNKCKEASDLVMNLENPRLNEVNLYGFQADTVSYKSRLGDNFPFHEREISMTQFGIPILIPGGDSIVVMMLVKHQNNTLQLPITLHTKNSLLIKIERSYLITGFTSGILLLTLLFSMFLFLKTRNFLFLFYGLYVLSTFMWLISTEGFGFQYLWPDHPTWATRSGPGFSVFNLCTFIAVALAYTKPYDNTRWVRNILLGIVFFTFLWGLQAFMPYISINNTRVMSFYLRTSFVVYGITLLLITSYLLYVSLTKNKVVLYYFFTGITTIVFSLLLIMQNSGWINLPLSSGIFISIGLVTEVILMTLGITTQFYQYKKEKETMLISFLDQQKAFTQEILDTQENERKRISREMHDDIGAGLTQIALMSESAKIKSTPSIQDAIAETCRKLVRNISEIIWTLDPGNKSLSHLCAYLREQLNDQLEYSGIAYHITLPDNERNEKQPDATLLSNVQRRNILLVTREIVNNAIKHSKAHKISISCEQTPTELLFTVNDDGDGFNSEKITSGNGLKNIRARIQEISGTIETVTSQAGTTFRYSIPL